MSYVTPEEVSRAREMDLLTYLRCYEPQELVKASSGEYSTRTHDSVKISNGKEYSFRIINPDSLKLHVFESAIDLMSYASLMKLQGGDRKKENYISMAGVFAPSRPMIPKSLVRYLEDADEHKILIHFDNDTAGISAAQSLAAALESKYEVGIYPPPEGKDYNDYLRIKRGERNYER